MSMKGWSQADVDAYKARQSVKTMPSASCGASEQAKGNLVAVKHSDATESTRNRYLKAKQPKGQPNKTEADYNFRYLGGQGIYEGVTFRLNGGSKYTPDWVFWSNGRMFAVECKGSYRFHSEGRALVAFLEARAKFKNVVFLWVQKHDNGEWIEKHVDERS